MTQVGPHPDPIFITHISHTCISHIIFLHRLVSDEELDRLVTEVEADKAAAEAAKRRGGGAAAGGDAAGGSGTAAT